MLGFIANREEEGHTAGGAARKGVRRENCISKGTEYQRPVRERRPGAGRARSPGLTCHRVSGVDAAAHPPGRKRARARSNPAAIHPARILRGPRAGPSREQLPRAALVPAPVEPGRCGWTSRHPCTRSAAACHRAACHRACRGGSEPLSVDPDMGAGAGRRCFRGEHRRHLQQQQRLQQPG